MNSAYLTLTHHGIKGQRWGIRRFQNEDGSLTFAGKKRYNINADGTARLKDSYRKSQSIKGGIKVAIGGASIGKGVSRIVKAKSKEKKISKRNLKKAIFSMALGSVVVASGTKNFINANKNRTINTIGMGSTPERFTGKPKTRAQVLASKKKKKIE